MARIRSVKPEFWDDRKLARSTSRDARLLYIGLWNQADEHSRCNGDPTWIKGRIFPYESDLGADECARLLDELARGEWVQRYTVDGDPFLYLPTLAKHQRLEPHKVDSRLPAPAAADADTPPDQQVCTSPSEPARRADKPAPDADESSLLYVAGSMEHGAGSRELPGAKPAPKNPRPRDDIWDALVSVCGIKSTEITKSLRGSLNAAVRDLRAVEATPAQITLRARRWNQKYPGAELTHTALAKHWATLNGSEASPNSVWNRKVR